MVLWEITLGTAYFLGLKRTYRLLLRTQRRLVTPKSPRIRLFLHRKTRIIFDTALKIHLQLLQKDIQVGRNMGSWILKWLDKMKPAAIPTNTITTPTKQMQLTETYLHKTTRHYVNPEFSKGPLTYSRNLWLTAYPTIAKMLRHQEPVMSHTQYRRFVSTPNTFELGSGFNGVIRNDIVQWLTQG